MVEEVRIYLEQYKRLMNTAFARLRPTTTWWPPHQSSTSSTYHLQSIDDLAAELAAAWWMSSFRPSNRLIWSWRISDTQSRHWELVGQDGSHGLNAFVALDLVSRCNKEPTISPASFMMKRIYKFTWRWLSLCRWRQGASEGIQPGGKTHVKQ